MNRNRLRRPFELRAKNLDVFKYLIEFLLVAFHHLGSNVLYGGPQVWINCVCGSPPKRFLGFNAEYFVFQYRVSEVTAAFVARFGQEYDRPITNRFVGGILRRRLRLSTYKSHGVYVVPAAEKPKVDQLCIRYGVTERSTGTVG